MTIDAGLHHLVDRACLDWERRKQQAAEFREPAAPPRPFTVALAREAAAGASPVAEELGRRLGWAVYDRNLVEHIAREMGLRASLLQSVDEGHLSWLTESMQAFMTNLASGPALSESAYVRHLVETVLALGAHGECVIVGRGSTHILPPESTLRVRLVAAFKDRVARAAEKLGLDADAAARYIREKDHERVRFIRDHFYKDLEDPRLFDLVLNTSRIPVSDCADLILAALRRMQARAAGG
jgi:cytidylate kinase